MVIVHRHEEWRIRSWEGDQFAELPLEGDEEVNDITYAPKPLDPASDAPEIATARAGKARRSKIHHAFTSVIDIIN